MMSFNTVPKGILIYVLMALAVLVPVSVYLVPAGIFSPVSLGLCIATRLS